MAEHPWLFALYLVGFLVLAWLLDRFSSKRARNAARKEIAAELKALEDYRAAAGRLIYQKPFTDDAAAIQAIDQVRDFDVETLQMYCDSTSSVNETVKARRAGKGKANGFRDLSEEIFKLYLIFQDKKDGEVVRGLGHQANNRYNELGTTALAAHLARHAISEAHILNALSSYIDAGKIITEVSPRS